MIDLTVSLVTADNKKLILDCLQSVYETTTGLQTEVYVVINDSLDDSEEAIRNAFPEVRLIVNREKLGFTHNHNVVMRRSKGKYILVLNDDTVMLDNAIKKMVDYMETSPRVGILGCKILNADRSLQWSCGSSYSHKFEYFKAGVLNALVPFLPRRHFRSTKEVSWVAGACFMVRAQAVSNTGPFDENIIIYYDDTDLCYRMIKAGWKVVFYPDAEIIHYHGQTRKKHFARDLFIIYQSRLYFFSKHYSRFVCHMLRIATIAEMALRYIRTLIFHNHATNQNAGKRELLNTYKRVCEMTIGSYGGKRKTGH